MPSVRLKQHTETKLFYVRVYDGHRQPREKVFPTHTRQRRAAETVRRRLEASIFEGEFDPWAPGAERAPARLGWLVGDGVQAFLAAKAPTVRPHTLRAYRSALRVLLGTLPPGLRLDTLRASHVAPFVLDATVADATRRHRLRHIRVFTRWATEVKALPPGVLDGIRMPKAARQAPVFFTPSHAARLLATTDALAPWLSDIVRFTLCTGFRRGEVCALRWSGVDLTPGAETVTVRSVPGVFETKSGNDLVVPLFADALAVVQRRASERGIGTDDGPVFTTPRGAAVPLDRLTKQFKANVRAAGLPEAYHFHTLRHTCGTWLTGAGAPLTLVSRVLNHSSIQVTQRYAHAAYSDVRAYGLAAFSKAM